MNNSFDLQSYLATRRKIIDKALERILPPSSTRPSVIHKAMRYGIFTGGKRIRPILCLAAAEAAGVHWKKALIPAMALELFHTYTLIHDDLPCMDDDDFRRGKPTVHKVFGQANAVLAGDALQAFAFEVLTKTVVPPPYSPNQLVLELARAGGSLGVVGGQVEDLASTGKKQSEGTISFVHTHKTADLFRASMRMGGIAAGAGKSRLQALTKYGMNIGLAFQMTDDLLDSEPDDAGPSPAKAGKAEFSCLALYSKTQLLLKARNLIRKSTSALTSAGISTEPLTAIANFILQRTN